jgi:hypothetical protein
VSFVAYELDDGGRSLLSDQLVDDSAQDDRARIDRILERLGETSERTERADLASELVRSCSRYEDSIERALRCGAVPDDVRARYADEVASHRKALRHHMGEVQRRTLRVRPQHVHWSDAIGFETALGETIGLMESLMGVEDSLMGELEAGLDEEEKASLQRRLERARKHASERPTPARTRLGRRLLVNLDVKLNHQPLDDTAMPHHRGRPVIHGKFVTQRAALGEGSTPPTEGSSPDYLATGYETG